MITQRDKLVKYCNHCNDKLVVGTNWLESQQKVGDYRCKDCKNKIHNDWVMNHQEERKIQRKKANKKWNDKNSEYYKDWKLANPDYDNEYYSNHKNSIAKSRKKYRKSKKGIIFKRKRNARYRGLGDVFLFDNPFDDNIPVVGHHISDGFEIYLPESLHINHLHGKYTQLHRDELKPYVESIYNISYILEEGD